LIAPVLCGAVAGLAIRGRRGTRQLPLASRLAASAGAAVLGGAILGLLAAASGGAAGPGRLAETGPNGLLVGLVAAGLVLLPAVLAQWGGATRSTHRPTA